MNRIETQQYIKIPNEIKRTNKTVDTIMMHKKNTPSSASEYQPSNSNVSPYGRREERVRDILQSEKKADRIRHERNISAPEG